MDVRQVNIDYSQLEIKELGDSVGDKIAKISLNEVGTGENPFGSNNVKYNTWFYGREVRDGYNLKGQKDPNAKWPWCCTFVCWVYAQAGLPMPKADWLKGWSYVPNFHNWCVNNKKMVTDPKAGDVVFMEFNGDKKDDHIGIFVKFDASKEYAYVVEGNTSYDSSGSQANGGCVAYRKRRVSLISGYARVI